MTMGLTEEAHEQAAAVEQNTGAIVEDDREKEMMLIRQRVMHDSSGPHWTLFGERPIWESSIHAPIKQGKELHLQNEETSKRALAKATCNFESGIWSGRRHNMPVAYYFMTADM
ncbi:hypothetical protein TREES_T100000173 [Tupaia chinensis]|uniref:Uncharacterized protein n=1 Tax=Tupaia chinensis TaxID=246437 RepID=L9LC44_TUPCH|nr:hypothetical protein TREES_T100000173 [Tupaia chinensis]